MNEAKFPNSLRKDLWTECANIATDMDNLTIFDKIFPYQAFHGKSLRNLNFWGDSSYQRSQCQVPVKIEGKGSHCDVFGIYQRSLCRCIQVCQDGS